MATQTRQRMAAKKYTFSGLMQQTKDSWFRTASGKGNGRTLAQFKKAFPAAKKAWFENAIGGDKAQVTGSVSLKWSSYWGVPCVYIPELESYVNFPRYDNFYAGVELETRKLLVRAFLFFTEKL